jgi:ComF family protein
LTRRSAKCTSGVPDREHLKPRNRKLLDSMHCSMALWGSRGLAGRALGGLVRLVAPDGCAACDAPVCGGAVFCAGCGGVPAPPEDVALGARVGGAYAPPLSTAIRRLKFGQRTDLAASLSTLLPCSPEWQGARVVPVPLHLTRLVERGFNPPGLLARRWCRSLGAEFAPWVLWRWRDTPHQVALSARERAVNVAGAFVAREGAAGRHTILLDDVVTTGATLTACRRALYAAGVVHVTVVALAAKPLEGA